MTRKSTIIAAIAIVLIGTAAVAYFNSDPGETAPDTAGQSTAPPRTPAEAPGFAASSGAAASSADERRKDREARDAELVEKYGEARTNLSRHVVGNVVSLLDDAIEMGEMMASGRMGEAFGGGDRALRQVLRDTGVELDDQQRAAAAELLADFQQREIAKGRGAIQTLKDRPTPLMELVLASDARARGELDEAEFEAVRETTAAELDGVVNPLDRNNFRGGRPLEDETFRSGFEAILEPDQMESFVGTIEEREQAADRQDDNRGISNIPVMELEKLDTAISSAKQMTSGFKEVMKGMGNLQELGPLDRQGAE